MKNKIIFLGVILFTILAGCVFFFQKTSVNQPDNDLGNISSDFTSTVTPKEIEVSVNIDFGNDRKVTGKVKAQNVYEALIKITSENNLVLDIKKYQFGVMVNKIGDKENKGNTGWTYLVNGKPGQMAADQYKVMSGDIIEWLYKNIT